MLIVPEEGKLQETTYDATLHIPGHLFGLRTVHVVQNRSLMTFATLVMRISLSHPTGHRVFKTPSSYESPCQALWSMYSSWLKMFERSQIYEATPPRYRRICSPCYSLAYRLSSRSSGHPITQPSLSSHFQSRSSGGSSSYWVALPLDHPTPSTS